MVHVKFIFASIFCFIIQAASAQYCADNRFTEVDFFSNGDIDSLINQTYGNALDWQGNNTDLKIDFYYPNSVVDTIDKRPFFLLIHGGSFTGGDKSDFTNVCKSFAKKGYVSATMSYRLGFNQSDPIEETYAVYRAQQDANAALRYCVEMAESLRIDTSWIFLGGVSAGSLTALFTHYGLQAGWDANVPGIAALLGHVDSSGNALTNTFNIKALYNNCGGGPTVGIGANPNELPNELIPMISFHGLLDPLAPIDVAPNGISGSRAIHDTLNANGICNDFSMDTTGVNPHCPHPPAVMISRTACFFKSLFCNTCSSFFSTSNVMGACASGVMSVNDITDREPQKVYPNPFLNKLHVTDLSDDVYFYLYDYLGRVIYEGMDLETQDFQTLLPGPYLLLLNDDGLQKSYKVLKK